MTSPLSPEQFGNTAVSPFASQNTVENGAAVTPGPSPSPDQYGGSATNG